MLDARSGRGPAGDAASASGNPAANNADETAVASTPSRFPTPQRNSEAAFLQTEASASATGDAEVNLPPRFELRRTLGAGGMGKVVLAHDQVLGRDVAIKVLRAGDFGDRAMRDRLLNEAQAAAQIRHPHIVSIHDVDLDAGLIVMEYLPSGSGRKLIEERGRIPFRELIPIARSLCSALKAAHEAGLIHRDIKPDNVLFDADGQVKVADFGVAQFRRKTTSGGSEIVGTPAYMAPEQLRGADPDPRADIYALGLTIYELATARRFHTPEGPADSSVKGLSRAVRHRGLGRVLARCLAEDPHHRFSSAQELDDALASLFKYRQRVRLALALAAMAVAIAVPLALLLPGTDHTVTLLKIASLPFENRAEEARLEWLSQGFANLLSSSLRRRGVPAVRHEQLRDLAGRANATATWEEAARTAGASDLVNGFFDRDGSALVVYATVRGRTYEARGRSTRADSLADEIAAGIARDILGEPAAPARHGRSPETIRFYELGYAALQQHEFQKAIDHLREAIRQDPDFVDARYALITARSSMNASDLSLVPDIDEALSRPLKPRERALFEALRLRVEHRYEEAATRYDRLVSQYPDEKEAHYGLADSLFHLGRGDQAIAAFKRLVKLAPSLHLAYRHPSDYYGTRGNAREMNAFLYHLRRAMPPPAFLALMETRLEIARRNYARALARAKSIPSPPPDLLATIAGIYAILGELDSARELFAQAAALAPEAWRFRIARAAIDLTQGHLSDFQGDSAWEASRAADPAPVARRLSIRGLLYALLGRQEAARRDLEVVRSVAGPKLQRELPMLLFLEGFVAWSAKEPGEIQELAKRLHGIGGKRFGLPAETTPFLAGAQFAAAGKMAAAVKKFREGYRAREDATYAPMFLLAIARSALESGDRAGAATACEEVLRPPAFSFYRAAALPPCLGLLARIRQAQGRADEARKHARMLVGYWGSSAVEIPEVTDARRILGEKN